MAKGDSKPLTEPSTAEMDAHAASVTVAMTPPGLRPPIQREGTGPPTQAGYYWLVTRYAGMLIVVWHKDGECVFACSTGGPYPVSEIRPSDRWTRITLGDLKTAGLAPGF